MVIPGTRPASPATRPWTAAWCVRGRARYIVSVAMARALGLRGLDMEFDLGAGD